MLDLSLNRVLHRSTRAGLAFALAAALAACGGGSGSSAGSSPPGTTLAPSTEAGAPIATGNTATDGFNWFNFRRRQMGLSTLSRNAVIDVAAQGHAEYQKTNDIITHSQAAGLPGFTGATLADRLRAAGYRFSASTYAYGEVISSTTDTSGFNAAEDLITAIYHRFVVFEPMFKEAGAGAATISKGYTYFTADMAADGLDRGLGRGKLAVYPTADQRNVLTVFNSDYESPDPVPGRNAVGFPVSVHADLNSQLRVGSFTLAPRGGAALNVILLQNATDPQTPSSAAAIIPYDVLASSTTYDVRFSGTVDGIAVERAWSFTTR